MRLRVRYVDAHHCLAWYGNVQLILSTQPPDYAFMQRIVSELAFLAAQGGVGTGALLVITSDVDPPDEHARDYIRRELAKSSMLAAAQVVEGTGFRGAAMRSVLSMVQLAMRPPYAMKIFDAVAPAAQWLTTELRARAGEAPLGFELVRVVRDLRHGFQQVASESPGRLVHT